MKKILMLLAVFCTMFGAVKAQTTPVDASFEASNVQYWIGEGSNQVVYSVVWADTALAWGYRFSEDSVTVWNVLDSIVATDSRLTYDSAYSMINDIVYAEGTDTFRLSPRPTGYTGYIYFVLSVNHEASMLMADAKYLHNGDFVKWADNLVAEVADSVWVEEWSYWDYTYVWPQTIYPASNPNAPQEEEVVDASFSANDVRYWIGEGWNEVVFSTVWADTAFAWGYRFAKDTVTVMEVMDAIAANDTHFSTVGTGYIEDIVYVDGTDTFRLSTPPAGYMGYVYFSLSVNHVSSIFGSTHPLVHGDFVKWGDNLAAVVTDSAMGTWGMEYTYAWPQTIYPAPAPAEVGASEEVFDGIVGTNGCQAIHFSDTAIRAWATTCVVTRGPQDIAEPTVFASFGDEANAIGAIDTFNSMDVVCLGDYGSAILTFDTPIQNGDGYDFAVFENAFNDSFLELAFVEVSSDGVNYFRFPAISNTPTDTQVDGFGSLAADKLNNLAGKYRGGWGTPFDLADLPEDTLLDINNITHVKIVDVVGSINPRYATRDSRGHIINDPYPNTVQGGGSKAGFDLAGVCVLNGWRPSVDTTSVAEYADNQVRVYPNPCNTQITVEANIGEPIMLFNSVGTLVYRTTADDTNMILNVSNYPAGLYILRCGNRTARIVKM